jgi:Flp pilus assembly protein TadB
LPAVLVAQTIVLTLQAAALVLQAVFLWRTADAAQRALSLESDAESARQAEAKERRREQREAEARRLHEEAEDRLSEYMHIAQSNLQEQPPRQASAIEVTRARRRFRASLKRLPEHESLYTCLELAETVPDDPAPLEVKFKDASFELDRVRPN